MELSQEQNLNAQVVQKAWQDAEFKRNLIANPVETIENFTGQKISLPEGQELVVVDQSGASKVYFNIPREVNINDLELTEADLEAVSGGILPLIGYGICVGIAIYAATHQ